MIFINTIIDNTYQVIEEIGSGGMGVIYLGYHLRLEKYIVLKQIKDSSLSLSMLRNEVDILKTLHHPYLPQVYDFFEFNGELYSVIDYINGYDLNAYIQSGYMFEESQLIKWLRQLCEVLEYLHSHTPPILHADIKPANIIVTDSGDICLIDFGVSLYNTDSIKGLSESYSSPEQYGNYYSRLYGTGEQVMLNVRTDIYSLGATYYHLLTGMRPNVADPMQPAISQFNLPYSQALIDIIDKAMQRDPNQRFRSVSAMRKAIDNIRKQDIRYRKYLLVQIVSSLVAVALIVSGILFTVTGFHNQLFSAYEKDYQSFIELSNRGDVTDAVKEGQKLLNNADYGQFLDHSEKANILHRIGDSYADGEDYYNAAYYYNAALEYNQSDTMYRDYALALVNDGQIDMAQKILTEIEARYADSAALSIINAQISYKKGDYRRVVDLINASASAFAGNTDNYFTAYLLQGDAYTKLADYSSAVQSYRKANEVKQTIGSNRRLANVYLQFGYTTRVSQYFSLSCDYYEIIANQYLMNGEDALNYAQVCLYLEKTDKYAACMDRLKDTLQRDADCRCYFVLANLGDRLNDPLTSDYCRKARQQYSASSEDQRMLISNEGLQTMKALYKKYCGLDW